MQANLALCNEALIDIIKDPKTSPQIKINAINTIYSTCGKMTELNDIVKWHFMLILLMK